MAALGRFGPPLALMAVIFALSSRRDLDPGGGLLGGVIPILAHLGLFGLLFALLWRAAPRTPAVAALVAILYGVGDELHQSTVPGRDATAFDVAVDALGVALTYVVLSVAMARRRHPRRPGHRPSGRPQGGDDAKAVVGASGDPQAADVRPPGAYPQRTRREPS